MCGIDPIFAHPDFRLWLQGDIQPPKIDFRLTPNSGHLVVHAGLPFVTQSGHRAAGQRYELPLDNVWKQQTKLASW